MELRHPLLGQRLLCVLKFEHLPLLTLYYRCFQTSNESEPEVGTHQEEGKVTTKDSQATRMVHFQKGVLGISVLELPWNLHAISLIIVNKLHLPYLYHWYSIQWIPFENLSLSWCNRETNVVASRRGWAGRWSKTNPTLAFTKKPLVWPVTQQLLPSSVTTSK
jgi:hypothetical protein